MILVRRLIAYYLDIITLSIIIYPYFLLFGKEVDGGYTWRDIYYLPLILVWYLYFVSLETLWGTTIGKRVLLLYVKKADGTNLTLIDIVKRRLFDLPELFFMPIIAGALAFFTPNKQRIGDLIANTIVVYKKGTQ